MIVVSSFKFDSIFRCMKHLKNYNNEEKKVIIDNKGLAAKKIRAAAKMLGLKNLVVVENDGNWEWSAWWTAYNLFPNEDRYLFIHDSMFLKKNVSYIFNEIASEDDIFIFDTREGMGWWSSAYDIKNANSTKKFSQIANTDRNDFNLVFGSMFACYNKTMKDLSEYGIMSISAENRCDAEACERLLGIAFLELGKNIILHKDRKVIYPPNPGEIRKTETDLFIKVRSNRSS